MQKVRLFLTCAVFLISNVRGEDKRSEARIDPLVLVTSQGLIKGLKAVDGDYAAFLGVPYAQVDPENPFGPSKPQPAFQEIIYNANNGFIQCPQMGSSSDNESLDCLRLNIFVPNKASSYNPLPVLVWIHGGDFVCGSAGEYGAKNLVKHDIIVVTVNYRLGPYGFMCLDTPGLTGNQGLKDQYTALSWIRSNIASFGGNPFNVTIAGQDAGATSVLLHLYSSMDKLYQKAIIESGTPQNEGMFVNSDANFPLRLAEYLGLQTNNTDEALEFLTNTPHNLVTGAAHELKLQLRPCKEHSFSGVENIVENDPYSLTNKKKVSKTPIIIGYTSQERDSLSNDYYDADPFYEKLKNNFNLNEEELEKAAKIVRRYYIGDNAVSPAVEEKLRRFESDFVYHHPAERMITKLLEEDAGSIYEYMFSYVGNTGNQGAPHSSELNYLFESGDLNVRSEEDKIIIDRMTTLWSNFVKYGNPTPSLSDLIPLEWTPVTKETRPSLIINTELRIENRVENERMAFWDLFYSIYGTYSTVFRHCTMSDHCC